MSFKCKIYAVVLKKHESQLIYLCDFFILIFRHVNIYAEKKIIQDIQFLDSNFKHSNLKNFSFYNEKNIFKRLFSKIYMELIPKLYKINLMIHQPTI
jgi:hypothetical protein